MSQSTDLFLYNFITLSPLLEKAYNEVNIYWEPDEPPIISIFGDLGGVIVEEYEKFPAKTIDDIFTAIESAMASGDEELSTAVATGTIESLAGRSWEKGDLWDKIHGNLHPISRTYAEDWLAA